MSTQLTEKSRVFINPQWSGRGAAYGPCAAFVRLPDRGQKPELYSVEDILNYNGEVLAMDYIRDFRPRQWASAMADILETAKGNFTVVWIEGLLGGGKKIREQDAATWIKETIQMYEEDAYNLRKPGGHIQEVELPE